MVFGLTVARLALALELVPSLLQLALDFGIVRVFIDFVQHFPKRKVIPEVLYSSHTMSLIRIIMK